jgi:putative salt-induced outer membrane protein YdiY
MRAAGVCVIAGLILSAGVASADELRLKNGDRVTGEAISLDAGKLTFKTAHGPLVVAWEEVAALTIDRQLLITTRGGEPRLGTLAGVTLADVVGIEAPAPPLAWSGGASLGLVASGGNTDVDSLRADGEVVARRPRDRFTTAAAVNRARDRGIETARNWTASFAYDRFLTRRLYATGNAIFTNDRFRGLDLRSAFGAGLGYDVWQTPRGSLSVDAGLAYVRETFDEAEDDSYAAVREGVRLSAFFAGRRVEAFHRHGGYFGVTGDDNLFFRMQNGVRLAIVAGLVSTVQLDLDYDRSPAPGRKTTDRTLALTLGYRF